MFLRRDERSKDGRRHTQFALVESRRTERGPRQRVAALFGELTENQQRRWQRTAVFLTRHEECDALPLFLYTEAEAAIANRQSKENKAGRSVLTGPFWSSKKELVLR